MESFMKETSASTEQVVSALKKEKAYAKLNAFQLNRLAQNEVFFNFFVFLFIDLSFVFHVNNEKSCGILFNFL